VIKVVPHTELLRTTHEDGKLALMNAPDWISGFMPIITILKRY